LVCFEIKTPLTNGVAFVVLPIVCITTVLGRETTEKKKKKREERREEKKREEEERVLSHVPRRQEIASVRNWMGNRFFLVQIITIIF